MLPHLKTIVTTHLTKLYYSAFDGATSLSVSTWIISWSSAYHHRVMLPLHFYLSWLVIIWNTKYYKYVQDTWYLYDSFTIPCLKLLHCFLSTSSAFVLYFTQWNSFSEMKNSPKFRNIWFQKWTKCKFVFTR